MKFNDITADAIRREPECQTRPHSGWIGYAESLEREINFCQAGVIQPVRKPMGPLLQSARV
jgi:hypothetical protein